ncbi:MAG: DUF6438 domain-containing protein [Candidatus Kapabacteria bacterium]|nr:DUF6438 domain-containing protein [Candidatus Kapabacteria bacterium]
MLKLFINLALACSLVACSSTPKEQTSADTDNQKRNELSIALSKSPCYGKCPVYSVNLDNRIIELNAAENTPLIGRYTTEATDDEIDSLIDVLKNAPELQEQDTLQFDQHITDMPYCDMTIKYDGKTKVIKYRFKLPEKVEFLDKFFTQILQEQFRWESK